MKNRQVLIGLAILVVGLLAAIMVFTAINNAPESGTGQTEQDNVSAGVPEAVPEAVGGTAQDQPPASQ